jgi:hypothetical protein
MVLKGVIERAVSDQLGLTKKSPRRARDAAQLEGLIVARRIRYGIKPMKLSKEG